MRTITMIVTEDELDHLSLNVHRRILDLEEAREHWGHVGPAMSVQMEKELDLLEGLHGKLLNLLYCLEREDGWMSTQKVLNRKE